MPHIQLPAEAVFPLEGHAPLFYLAGQPFYITNTMISVWLAMVIIIVIAWNIRKQLNRGDMVLTGVAGAIAALLEGFYGMTESTAGKWAKKIFPWFGTIFLLVLFVNLQELVPGPDAFGYLHESEHGNPKQELLGGAFETIVPAEEDAHSEEGHGYALVPFWRVASTDLNFTLSLAIISVVMTQVIGFQALGGGYLTKYWNGKDVVKAWKQPRFGNPMDFIIGLVKWFASVLEIIAEISKILSFTFRLFGVIFAGSVLLFFLGSMTGGLGQSIAVLLELLFGPLQALVFGMLTMMFMSMATVSHDHDHEEGHH
jgi:F-type H+-transporting ATPase subunit a